MEKLREEILQAEQARSGLLKWKLGLVGGIGALGLGFSGHGTFGHAEFVLALIPFVCVYVDLLSRHLSLRIVVIGTFLRTQHVEGVSEATGFRAYEEFVDEVRKAAKPFDLEDWAVEYSTFLLSLAVFAFGWIYLAVAAKPAFSALFLISGLAGLATTWWGRRAYKARFETVVSVRGHTSGRTL